MPTTTKTIQKLIKKEFLDFFKFHAKEINILLEKLSNLSKPYLFNKKELLILSHNDFKYYELYLEPKRIYEEYFHTCSEIFQEYLPNVVDQHILINEQLLTELSEDLRDFDNFTDSCVDELISNVLSNKEFDDRTKFVINATICRFFESLSVIDNKKQITVLLQEALNNNIYLNIPKAVSIDPNILKLPQINEYIHNQTLEIRAEILKKCSLQIEEPFLSNKRNKISPLPYFYISFIHSLGLIDGKIRFSYKQLESFADDIEIIDKDFDLMYFREIFNIFKKSRDQVNNV